MLFELTGIDLALPLAIQRLFKTRKAHFGLTSVFALSRECHVEHSILFGRAVIQRDRQETLARVQFHLRLEGHAIVSIQYGSYGQALYLLANYLITRADISSETHDLLAAHEGESISVSQFKSGPIERQFEFGIGQYPHRTDFPKSLTHRFGSVEIGQGRIGIP